MAHFKNTSFIFDNIRGEEFGLEIATIGGYDTSTSFFGLDRDIIEEDDGFLPMFKGVKTKTVSIPITLVHARNGNLVPFTNEDKYKINSWLFKNEYKPFMSDDNKGLVYYVIFTKGEKFENKLQEGYINLTMRLNAGYAFSHIKRERIVCSSTENLIVKSMDNVTSQSLPDINLKVKANGNVTITNFTNGSSMTFKNLTQGMEIMCYNEGMKQIVCLSNPSLNLRANFEKDWLVLNKGNNRIQVSGNCEVTIIHQDKIALQ